MYLFLAKSLLFDWKEFVHDYLSMHYVWLNVTLKLYYYLENCGTFDGNFRADYY